jgi:hypothetical protein
LASSRFREKISERFRAWQRHFRPLKPLTSAGMVKSESAIFKSKSGVGRTAGAKEIIVSGLDFQMERKQFERH